MRLIGLAVVFAMGLTLAPLAGEAQQAGTVPRIGVLSPSAVSDPRMQRRLEALSPSPAPASSNGANGFPVRRSPVRFAPWVM
jgi:hypothetical protein